jgi:hypothetical protein
MSKSLHACKVQASKNRVLETGENKVVRGGGRGKSRGMDVCRGAYCGTYALVARR